MGSLRPLGLLVSTWILSAAATSQTPDYPVTDQVEGDVYFNPVPRRPMVLAPGEQHLYAVNTHASTVVHFDRATPEFAAGQPSHVFPVPKSPVSIGLWSSTPGGVENPDRIVVVCDGTYCLVILDRATGETLELMELRGPGAGTPILGEPGDLLIDQVDNRAFVSCAAADAVLEINLVSVTPVRKFDLPAKDPVFMCFDGTANRDVLVAPQLSGNNSGARHLHDTRDVANVFNLHHVGPTVIDFAEADQVPGQGGLPDQDLFRCRRDNGLVEPVTRGMGTVQFACGIHPGTGKVWQLNTEANNKDEDDQGESEIKGEIVQNRISLATLPARGAPPASPFPPPVDLDELVPGESVGQPYALAFASTVAGVQSIVCGLLTDNIMIAEPTGSVHVRELPDGSIPRGLLYSASDELVLVYCWGTARIERHPLAAGLPAAHSLDLGYDPLPEQLKTGRRIFYDGAHSADGNASCASCHVEGRTDMIVWNLSKGPMDDKGPMLTQTLAGIQKVVPFHWRGEQAGLVDFNPAFVNLLGAPAPLEPAEFEAFERFVFSIQNRPNPFQNEERILDATIDPPLLPAAGEPDPDAIAGRDLFIENGCERCHNFPTGTNNDMAVDGNNSHEQNPQRIHIKTASFQDLYRRNQDADRVTPHIQLAPIQLLPDDIAAPEHLNDLEDLEYPLLGAAFTHAGLSSSLHSFVASPTFSLTAVEEIHIAAFLHQWDQGVAPAVYRGVLLKDRDGDNALEAHEGVAAGLHLVAQADLRNCDVVVYGSCKLDTVTRSMRWYYDRDKSGAFKFKAEDPAVPDANLPFFEQQVELHHCNNVVLGLPVGAGRRFAIDYDGDDLENQAAAETAPYVPLSNPPAGVAPTILRADTRMVTGKVARINVETSEPCRVTINYRHSSSVPYQTKTTAEFARTHSILLTDLLPSTVLDPATGVGTPWLTYAGYVSATDRAGQPAPNKDLENMPAYNQGLVPPSALPITTRAFVPFIQSSGIELARNQLVVGSLVPNTSLPSTIMGGIVHVDQKVEGPPAVPKQGVRIIARVFVNGVLSTNVVAKQTTYKYQTLRVTDDDGAGRHPFTGLPGPFLVSPLTNASGQANLAFKVPNVLPSDDVLLHVEMIAADDTRFGLPGLDIIQGIDTTEDYTIKTIDSYDRSSTPAANRGLTF